MINILVKRLCLVLLLVLMVKPASAEYSFDIRNECFLPLSLALHYKDIRTGSWRTTPLLYVDQYPLMYNWTTVNGDDGPLLTDIDTYYYYAELYDNDAYTWSFKDDARGEGLKKLRVDDRTLYFRKVTDTYGANDLEFDCYDIEDAKSIYIHNDCDANVDIGIRHLRVNGKWGTWYNELLPGEHRITTALTRNRSIGYYAKSTDGSRPIWRGSRRDADPLVRKYHGKYVVYKRTNLGDSRGKWSEMDNRFKLVLRCDNHSLERVQSAARTPVHNNKTELRIIYRDYRYFPWPSKDGITQLEFPHAMLVAVHPKDPLNSSIYIDAWPAKVKDNDEAKKTRVCTKHYQLCSNIRNAAFTFDKPGYENYQSVFINMSFDEVVSSMLKYTRLVDSRRIKYRFNRMNCNSFVFTFLRLSLGLKDIEAKPNLSEGKNYPIAWKTNVPIM